MKKTLLLSLFTLLSIGLFAQKVKIKDGFATIDGEKYVKWEKADNTAASISGLNSETEDIFAQWLNYKDPNQVQKSNPEGYVRWVELNFLDLDMKCEVMSQTRKSLVKMVLKNKLYVDGVLNQENVERFVKKYGAKFSANRPNGNVNIIINN